MSETLAAQRYNLEDGAAGKELKVVIFRPTF